MVLGHIADMKDYLADRCYCPGEIYDVTGFFFQIFKPEEECKQICMGKSKNGDDVYCVICRDQIINIWVDNNKVTECERYDATENNIELFKRYWSSNGSADAVDGAQLDEFEPGSTQKSLEEIMSIADAVII